MKKSIKGTLTEQNLLKAFAGECQAKNRYELFAEKAKKEGYEQIAAIFAKTAIQEQSHAKQFIKFMEGGAVEITSEYSTGISDQTLENLQIAINEETREETTIYTQFSEIARSEGFPAIADAGNVLRPKTTLKLSMRLPPTVSPKEASAALHRTLTENPPYDANVSFHLDDASMGWHAPLMADWLALSVDEASQTFFKKPAVYMGEGGTIPFMSMLGQSFPKAQFVITGVLGPRSNAHGPNEFLHLDMVKKLTSCISYIIYQHFISTSP